MAVLYSYEVRYHKFDEDPLVVLVCPITNSFQLGYHRNVSHTGTLAQSIEGKLSIWTA